MLAERMKYVSYAIRDIILEAKRLESQMEMLYLNVGDPCKFDFRPPMHIREAVAEAVRSGDYSAYAPSQGDPELRELVNKTEGTEVSFITAGLAEGIDLLFQALVDHGDLFLMPSPSYPLYVTKSKIYARRESYYPLDENWWPIPEEVEKAITPRTKAILMINPNNPTGAVYPPKIVKALGDIAAAHNIPLIADEIYWALVYDGEYKRAADVVSEDVPLVVANGLSKSFFYPGARIGWLALRNVPEELVDALTRLTNARLSINWEMQRGAVAALKRGMDFLPPYLEKLRRRRDVFYKRFSEIDHLSLVKPEGAFYSVVQYDLNIDDWDFVRGLLKYGVVTVPASAFSSVLPKRYVRMVFLPPEEKIERAAERTAAFIKSLNL